MPAFLLNWSLLQFQALILILLRVTPILFFMPVVSSRSVPAVFKIGMAFSVGLILLPVVKIDPAALPGDPFEFARLMLFELMIGFVLSLSVNILFAAVQTAGELIAFQMGFSMASVVDPQSEASTPVISQFVYYVAILVFLAIDGHHWFFRAVYQSFLLLAPGEFHLKQGLYTHILSLVGEFFVIAVKLTAPVLAVLLFTQIALGILARAVPQMNILMTSFSLTIGIGLVFLALSMDVMLPYLEKLLQGAGRGLPSTLLPLMAR
ncbi:MAG TPA: flagellar biosynthetic protein FliR [Thermodesulfobacteriota bacterium]|nr:flagellar biosynthetic protein FliR [Thermodesulfobacteriota bacterium]